MKQLHIEGLATHGYPSHALATGDGAANRGQRYVQAGLLSREISWAGGSGSLGWNCRRSTKTMSTSRRCSTVRPGHRLPRGMGGTKVPCPQIIDSRQAADPPFDNEVILRDLLCVGVLELLPGHRRLALG
jgi:hypothetical protein